MTVKEMGDALSLTLLAGNEGLEKTVETCYIGDLLSWVMARAPERCAWITVMGNVNALAVAELADASAILLCENASLDDEAKAKADENGVPILISEEPAYPLALKIARLLGQLPE